MSDMVTMTRAGRVLSDILGGTVVPRDVAGAPPGTHDLDLVLGDGRIIAVEETVSTDRRTEGPGRPCRMSPGKRRNLRLDGC